LLVKTEDNVTDNTAAYFSLPNAATENCTEMRLVRFQRLFLFQCYNNTHKSVM